MASDNLTDADVLALIDEDDRRSWKLAKRAIAAGYEDQEWIIDLLRRLALARREAREAATVERAACLREVTDYHDALMHERSKLVLLPVAARIRARGQS